MRLLATVSAIVLLGSAPLHADFYEWWQIAHATYDVPATFTFGIERAGDVVEFAIPVAEFPQPPEIFAKYEFTVNAANAAAHDFDWDAFQAIAGGDEVVRYLAWWSCDKPIKYKFGIIELDHQFVAVGGNQPHFFPAEVMFSISIDKFSDNLFARMQVTDARKIPEPESWLPLSVCVVLAGCWRSKRSLD